DAARPGKYPRRDSLSTVETEMNRAWFSGRRSVFALLLASIIVSGCNPTGRVDGSKFDAAKWEKQMQSPSLDERQFTKLYAQAAAAQFKDAKVEITGPREVSVTLAEGGSRKALLDNAWAQASQDPARRADICRRYLKTLADSISAKGGPPATNSIVAIVRPEAYLKDILKAGEGTTNRLGNRPVFEPLAADLQVVYASDQEGAIAMLIESDRVKLGLELPALRKLALENLQRL